MASRSVQVDCVVLGGGVAGLWLLHSLRERGYRTVLLEAQALGAGQTIASQGILHSGLKYSLRGLVSAAAREAREMPALWRRCLAGEASPSLVGTEVRSQHFHLWGTDSAASRLGMFGAKLGLKVTPQTLSADQRPELLRACRGAVYRVDEQVLSPASLLAALARPHADCLIKIDPEGGLQFCPAKPNRAPTVRLQHAGETVELNPNWLLLAAGSGNEHLRIQLGLAAQAMQRRPLHMVLMRGPLPEFYGHCVDGGHTRVSITSAIDSAGRVVWQVGGQIAEDGVAWGADELIAKAKAELAAVLPNLDLTPVEWATYQVDRAEGATRSGSRPDSFRLLREDRVLTVWPTKLVLAPQLAEAVGQVVGESAPTSPDAASEAAQAWANWPRPLVAQPPWEGAAFTTCNCSHLTGGDHNARRKAC